MHLVIEVVYDKYDKLYLINHSNCVVFFESLISINEYDIYKLSKK